MSQTGVSKKVCVEEPKKEGWFLIEQEGPFLINAKALKLIDTSQPVNKRILELRKHDLEDLCRDLGFDYEKMRRCVVFDSIREGVPQLEAFIRVVDDLRHEELHGWSANIFWRWRHGIEKKPPSAIWAHSLRRGGLPCLRGTRFTISQVLAELADGCCIAELAEDFDLDVDMIEAALRELALTYERSWR